VIRAPAVRRANRDAAGGTSHATTDQDTALPQAPTGPRAAVIETRTNGAAGSGPCREERCSDMATMTKVRNRLERVSALKGWRMRWHMQ
jgi:hypothetical protein